mmetsp:Transcript_16126/g.20072  ORF Transcript_16126/g.20072 Transcript_16126/m.20072 type:complete len:177 (-) Transcript_16126:281-811(-)|eukprot:CAMPEP_0172478360 /NCGR_PEP_ID=MMETSP1066-20121228/2254_1 /TAXON_ID=671091 /ORGANISM="Coscinodiscus wailesii, Strain CCMP2513" /LENGTH=176 /DNA_ID=CAMNT_0013237863 /DNA_START=107 /DNA_END=637 /DNA_ORIENTATION=+
MLCVKLIFFVLYGISAFAAQDKGIVSQLQYYIELLDNQISDLDIVIKNVKIVNSEEHSFEQVNCQEVEGGVRVEIERLLKDLGSSGNLTAYFCSNAVKVQVEKARGDPDEFFSVLETETDLGEGHVRCLETLYTTEIVGHKWNTTKCKQYEESGNHTLQVEASFPAAILRTAHLLG